jgi:archaemetzincin
MKPFRFLLFSALSVVLLSPTAQTREPTSRFTVAIQPLGSVAPSTVNQVQRGIASTFQANVIVLKSKSMSPSTLSARSGRYRAEKILQEAERDVHPTFTKILVLTEKEISATKGRHHDWSISGYGLLAQRPCVVSTYRIRRRNSSAALFNTRLIKIANHELGHTLGLDHCSQSACLMADMKGSMRGLDLRTGTFCSTCHQKLKPYLKKS